MYRNSGHVRVSENLRRALKQRSAAVNVSMVELVNLFIIEGLSLRNDHIQKLLAIQESHELQEEHEVDVATRLALES